MKKKYVKPELIYEQYMLNQHMASSCNFEKNQTDALNCQGYVGAENTEFAGMKLFPSNEACGPDRSVVETYCYWNSAASIVTVGLSGSGG